MKPSTRSTQSASPPTSWTARLRGREREGGREGGRRVDYRYSCFDFADYLYLQAGLDRSIHIPGYHALDSVGTERKIQTLAKSMFRKDIIGGGLAGSIHGSAYLKLSALQSGFNG